MCGLIGFSGLDVIEEMKAGLLAIHHRGPDDSGFYFDDSSKVGLGHTRLSILELTSLGHQPMLSDDEQVVLIFNGEIYNYVELRKDLIAKGCKFRGHSDTEVLLQLYMQEGEEMLPKLNGIFALAIWDVNKKSLLLARDALGVKPLYIYESAKYLAFSSEIKALTHLMPENNVLDEVALNRYLSFLWCPGNRTPFVSVKKLGPGEAWWVKDGQVSKRFTWYQLPVTRVKKFEFNASSAIKKTEELVRLAVHRQMVSDVPVGAFLSGGLDSSSVVAFAREKQSDIQCFTIKTEGGQDDGVVDDLPYARLAAAHLKVPLQVVTVDAAHMASDLESLIYQLDEPLADPASLNLLYMSRVAKQNGIKVLLSGAGGDDIFSGYRRHQALNSEKYWNWLPSSVRKYMEYISANLDQKIPTFRKLSKLFNGAHLTGDARIVNYFMWTNRQDLEALYTPSFKSAIKKDRAELPMMEYLSTLNGSVSNLDKMLALEQRFFLPDHNLTYTDKMSMAVGVEVRVPFLDLDLVNFTSTLPDKLKQNGKQGKWILKKAMEHYLPQKIIYRPKSGFGSPVRRWMRNDWRELLGDLLSVESVRKRGLFDPHAVQRLILKNNVGAVDASYTLLSLLCIEIWCRLFIDNKSKL